MNPKIRRFVVLAAAIAVLAAAPAWAGGKECAREGATHTKQAKAMKTAGWTGMEVEKTEAGYTVTSVYSGSPAAAAGIRTGDQLVAYEGITLAESNKEALHAAKKGRQVGHEVTYTVARSGQQRDVRLAVVEVPDTVIARWLAAEDEAAAQVAAVDN